MEITSIKIIETAITVAVYILIRFVSIRAIDKTVTNNILRKTRGKIIKKVINFSLLITISSFILIIWGVDQSEMVAFMATLLTVIGIALFAQWSLLSNITSGIIMFFTHSVRLDDTIVILDKDYEIEGRISDIGLFFVILKMKDGDQVSIPSNVFIQKMIRKKTTI